MIVLSPTLCQHPDYRPEESSESVVDCTPADADTPIKPRDLVKLEAESLRLRSEKMFEGEFMQGNAGPGSVRIEIKEVQPTTPHDTDEDLEEDAAKFHDQNWPRTMSREPFKPLMDPEVVREFLLGDYCLYGGSGWWKYEFCYGKKVDQYHQERDGRKTVINLGVFDRARHLDWLDQHPGKRPKPVESRKHVSHFYSGGDICDLTGDFDDYFDIDMSQ